MKTKANGRSSFERASSDAVATGLSKLQKLLAEVVNDIPVSQMKKSKDPEAAARGLSSEAARTAAAITGALALPAGPLGVLSIAPDLVAVWRRQARLVSDISAVYGRSADLNREMMMYCLFRHVASDAVKDIVVRTGQRAAVSRLTTIMFYRLIRLLVGEVLARMAGRFMMRWLPVIGAATVAAYSYRDTKLVGETAIATFSSKSQSASTRGRARA